MRKERVKQEDRERSELTARAGRPAERPETLLPTETPHTELKDLIQGQNALEPNDLIQVQNALEPNDLIQGAKMMP
jgi:hypothetical protein